MSLKTTVKVEPSDLIPQETIPTAISDEKTITILHFNDVYNVESTDKEPVGGAARFSTALKSYSHVHPLILFSGDVFSPSLMSPFTKGEEMIPVLVNMGIHCATYGNHDFDFGIDVLIQRAKATPFPWLMSNVIDNATGNPLADGKYTLVIDWQGTRIGLIGLAEKEWLHSLMTVEPKNITYTDYVECGRSLARNLRDIDGCKFVIALTHMRMPNDLRLAKEVEEIDLILGGHDHVSQFIQVENRYIVKSGTDFQQFSEIALRFSVEEGKPLIRVRRVDVTSEYDEDMNLKPILDGFQNMIGEKMGEVLGEFGVPLDGRSTSVRTSESNLGNFICDIMMASTKSDLALLTSGTLRSDRIHPPGPFTLRDLNQILPMLDNLVVVEISGAELLATLENGVSQYPKLEGRFLQVGGMSFAFDPMKPPLQRVDPRFVRIGDQYLELQTKYRLITKSFMHAGSHGFHVLNKTKILVGEEDNMTLIRAVQTHFETLKKLQTALELRQQSSTRELEKAFFYKLEPRVEGRIVIIDQDTLHQLLSQRQFKDKLAK